MCTYAYIQYVCDTENDKRGQTKEINENVFCVLFFNYKKGFNLDLEQFQTKN